MICHMKYIFVWIFLIPQPTDGGSVTWHEPTPARTTSKSTDSLQPVIVPVYEGSSVTLTWSYTLTLSLNFWVIDFNGDGIVSMKADGSAGLVRDEFRQRFSASSTRGKVSLVILNVTVADDKANGEFTCELFDSNSDTWKRAIQVQVIVPTSIRGISGERIVLESSSLQLTCKASGRPEPNITWTKEKPGNQENTGVVQEGKVLTITNINSTNAGNYTCTAYNGFGKPESQTVCVDVTYPPKIVNFQHVYTVNALKSLTLNCEVEGNPPPTCTWTPCDKDQVCDKNTLDISQVLNDTSYTCRVANVHGNDSKTASVYIGGNVINITIVITSETCIEGNYNHSLLEKLEKLLEEAFGNKPGFEGVQFIDVRCGSIIVDLALKFNTTTKGQDVITTLYDAVKGGKLGEFSVGAIKGKRPDLKTTSKGTSMPTVSPSGGIAWWIIFVILLAVVIVVGLLVILIKQLKVHSNERGDEEKESGYDSADTQYEGASSDVNDQASHLSSVLSVTDEVATKSSEGRRGNRGAPKEQTSEYAVVSKTKKKKKTPKPGELQYAELGELTGRGQKATMPRVSGTDTVYADIKS